MSQNHLSFSYPTTSADLLKYSHCYNTATPTQTKLPSLSSILGNHIQLPSPITTGVTFPSDPIATSRSNSFHSLASANSTFSRQPSLSTNASLETLTNVAQQSFGIQKTRLPLITSQQSFPGASYTPLANSPNSVFSGIPHSEMRQHASSISSVNSYLSYSVLTPDPVSQNIQPQHQHPHQHQSPISMNNFGANSPGSSSSSSLNQNSQICAGDITPPHSSPALLLQPKSKKKKRMNLPKKSTSILISWLSDNLDHPYPNNKEKMDLIRKTGLNAQQLSNWFINARRRKMNILRDLKGK